jgi:beta-N-acetylhexosaminidase
VTRAFICGCAGPTLSDDERAFLRESQPFGVILFKRNIETPEQVRALTGAVRDSVGADVDILVDQEGGRVQRIGPPLWRRYPAAARLAAVADAPRFVRLAARLMAHDLRALGISVDCMPVLDVPTPGAHDVIGDRAYGREPETVAALGRAAAEGLLAGGILPVMKHVPGHGRALADSHHALPVVTASRAALAADFLPFRRNRDLPAAMTAHVVYTAVDPDRPATISPRVVGEIIRGEIGFDGLLMSDDLSMKALGGSFRERTAALFAAGVDLVLHCNGDMAEAAEVAAAAPMLAGRALARADAARAAIAAGADSFDPVDAATALDAALAITV